jgi:hypothetical protein
MHVEHSVRVGAYGVDAPRVILTFAVIASVVLLVSALLFALAIPVLPWITLAGGLFCALTVADLLYTTLAGKFAVWSESLGGLDLRGDEKVLDVGCGRGRCWSQSQDGCGPAVRSASTCGAPAISQAMRPP